MKDPANLYRLLRAGDETAFTALVNRMQRSMVGVATGFVGDRATAEEVVQETWLAVIEGLDGFEERASLKNWIFAILANKARSRATRDRRMIPVADFTGELGGEEAFVEGGRFDVSGAWSSPPSTWDDATPERIVAGKQLLAHVKDAIDRLPPAQRSVLLLREVEGMDPSAIGVLLDISEGNQRVLLHRARSRIRTAVEQLLGT